MAYEKLNISLNPESVRKLIIDTFRMEKEKLISMMTTTTLISVRFDAV